MTRTVAVVERVCRQCGHGFVARRNVVSRGPNWAIYCSIQCKAAAQSNGNTRALWRESKAKRRGYPRVLVGGKSVSEHVLIAERALGKRLPAGAVVHHVDGDRANNAPSNLVICQDHRYHMLLHVRARIVARGANPNTHKRCPSCDCVKPTSDFWRYRRYVDGYETTCKACLTQQRLARKSA